MVEWRRHPDHDLENSVAESDSETDSDWDGENNSDTRSSCLPDDDLTTDAAGPDQGLALAVAKASDVKPSFGNIAVNNSTDVHFGNKTFYNGPVTIKQFVYTSSVDESSSSQTADNGAPARQVSLTDGVVAVPESTELPHDVHLKPPEAFAQRLNGSFHHPSLSQPIKDLNGGGILSKWARLKTQRCVLVGGAVVLALLLVTLMVLVLTLTRQVISRPEDSNNEEETVGNVETEANFTLSPILRIIPRHEWLALPVTTPPDPLHTPVPYVIISHTATETCLTNALCTLQVRTVQTFHIKSRNWWDIGYNFLVGGDGFAYVGRGWDAVGAHAYGYNNRSIGISFIGTFNDVLPPRKQIEAAKKLIEKGVELGKVAKDYKLLAHRQVSGTESPGKTLFENMKTWPHWAESP